jgi:hypothetical protein
MHTSTRFAQYTRASLGHGLAPERSPRSQELPVFAHSGSRASQASNSPSYDLDTTITRVRKRPYTPGSSKGPRQRVDQRVQHRGAATRPRLADRTGPLPSHQERKDLQRPRRHELRPDGQRSPDLGMTPITDTNELGHSRTPVDPRSVAFQAGDGVGHFGWALQARGHSRASARRRSVGGVPGHLVSPAEQSARHNGNCGRQVEDTTGRCGSGERQRGGRHRQESPDCLGGA